jgi:hypothetical protein
MTRFAAHLTFWALKVKRQAPAAQAQKYFKGFSRLPCHIGYEQHDAHSRQGGGAEDSEKG